MKSQTKTKAGRAHFRALSDAALICKKTGRFGRMGADAGPCPNDVALRKSLGQHAVFPPFMAAGENFTRPVGTLMSRQETPKNNLLKKALSVAGRQVFLACLDEAKSNKEIAPRSRVQEVHDQSCQSKTLVPQAGTPANRTDAAMDCPAKNAGF